ncbi:MAG: UDP-2,3-diacylglucosamine diphosphatase [Thiovulaceae bacterium]|nr:UDP-2,3-diacylglucosamine diphosphatase [Sulfurimonadaceae bacterium]
MIEIKDGAFVVSDAHYSHKRPHLLNFFKDIQSKKLKPTQLILMGDIFDVLIGGVKKTIESNEEIVNVLNDISKDIEVVLLEGNHDFNLKNIFKSVKIFALSEQPIECKIDSKKAYLAHGDFDGGFWYKFYTLFIRNPFILSILSLINKIFNNIILDKLDKYLDKKDDCKKIENFENIIKKRIDEKFECDYFIEGHFHQNKNIKLKKIYYINLAAFACNQRYFIVRFVNKELLQSNKYLGE